MELGIQSPLILKEPIEQQLAPYSEGKSARKQEERQNHCRSYDTFSIVGHRGKGGVCVMYTHYISGHVYLYV